MGPRSPLYRGKVNEVMLDEIVRGKAGKAMLDETTRDKVGDAALDEAAHGKVGKVMLVRQLTIRLARLYWARRGYVG